MKAFERIAAIFMVMAFVSFSISGCEAIERQTAEVKAKEKPLKATETVVVASNATYKPVYTKVHCEESDSYVWNELSKYSPNDQITAGVMGYFWKESKMRSDAVAGWDARNRWKGQDIDICVEFTEEVDSGLDRGVSKDYFKEMVMIKYGGYGLGQWLSQDYLEDLYEFVRARGGSIGDANLQCEFVFQSLRKNERLWGELMQCKTAEQCGRRIGTLYDGNDEAGAELIASAAKQYYKKYHSEGKL